MTDLGHDLDYIADTDMDSPPYTRSSLLLVNRGRVHPHLDHLRRRLLPKFVDLAEEAVVPGRIWLGVPFLVVPTEQSTVSA
jgi:hypothetical protein